MALSAAQRQAKLARKKKGAKQRAKLVAAAKSEVEARHRYMMTPISRDRSLVVVDLRQQLYGSGDEQGGYSMEQIAHVDAIIDAYTPDEFAAALQAAAERAEQWRREYLRNNPDDHDLLQ